MSGRRPSTLLFALGTACLSYSLLQTMVVPALPTLQREFDTTREWATWLFTGFLLVSAVATTLIGRLGDQRGKRRMLLITLSIYAASLIAAVFARDIGTLIAIRCLQGVGGATFPLAFSILRDELPEERVGPSIGLISSVFGIGGSVGLLLSGVLLEHAGWQWIFALGAILATLGLALVALLVPESPVKNPSRTDFPGAILFTLGLIGMLVSLTQGQSWGWTSPALLGLVATSILIFVVWARVELRVREPLIDVRLLTHRPVLITNIAALITGYAVFGVFALLPGLAQAPDSATSTAPDAVSYGLGASPVQFGIWMLPNALAMVIFSPIAGRLGNVVGFRWMLGIGMALIAAGAGLLAAFHDTGLHLMIAMTVLGIGTALAFSAMPTLMIESVPDSVTGVATGLNTVFRTVGSVIGGQLGVAILAATTLAGTGAPQEAGYAIAFGIAAVISLAAVPLCTMLPRTKPVHELVA